MSVEEVLYDMSYSNVILYGSALPSGEEGGREKRGGYDNSDTLKVDDPRNIDALEAVVKNMNK